MVVQNTHERIVLHDVFASRPTAINGAIDHAEVRCEVDNSRFQRVVTRQDVVQLKVGITDHIQQDKGVNRSHILFGQILGPSLCTEGVLLVLVLGIVEEQDDVVVKAHGWNVFRKLEQDGHSTGGVVCARDRLRLVAFVDVLVGDVPRIVMRRKDQQAR